MKLRGLFFFAFDISHSLGRIGMIMIAFDFMRNLTGHLCDQAGVRRGMLVILKGR
jgi:hypothetical protein